MTRAIIVHGWSGSPRERGLQWLKEKLEERGMEVIVPEMPDADYPRIDAWMGKLAEVGVPDEETIYIGHSIGCQTILRYLETLPDGVSVAKVVLLAPWMELDKRAIKYEKSFEIARPWEETPIDFDKVRTHAKEFVAIFSDNDHYVSSAQKEVFEQSLGAQTKVEHGRGHFSIGDGVVELPEVLECV